jgi:hypothetical protein
MYQTGLNGFRMLVLIDEGRRHIVYSGGKQYGARCERIAIRFYFKSTTINADIIDALFNRTQTVIGELCAQAREQFNSRNSIGKSRVVVRPGNYLRAALSGVQNPASQPVSREINGGHEACGTGTDNDAIVHLPVLPISPRAFLASINNLYDRHP